MLPNSRKDKHRRMLNDAFNALSLDFVPKEKTVKPHQARTLKGELSPQKEAHRQVQWAVRHKILEVPSKCNSCKQKKRVEAHHDDYSEPLVVRWLCRSCHMKWHKQNSTPELRQNDYVGVARKEGDSFVSAYSGLDTNTTRLTVQEGL